MNDITLHCFKCIVGIAAFLLVPSLLLSCAGIQIFSYVFAISMWTIIILIPLGLIIDAIDVVATMRRENKPILQTILLGMCSIPGILIHEFKKEIWGPKEDPNATIDNRISEQRERAEKAERILVDMHVEVKRLRIDKEKLQAAFDDLSARFRERQEQDENAKRRRAAEEEANDEAAMEAEINEAREAAKIHKQSPETLEAEIEAIRARCRQKRKSP